MDRLLQSRQPHPRGAVTEAQNDDAMRRFAAHGLEPRYHPRNLPPVGAAHPGWPPVAVQVDMKNPLALGAAVIGGLHRPSDGITTDSRADIWIIYIFTIGDGMIARQKNQ